MTGWLVFLPAALVVMCLTLYKLWRGGQRAQSPRQRHDVAMTGCRLGSVSSLMLAMAGLGCLRGPAQMLGWVMIALGLTGATTGYVLQLYLVKTSPTESVRQPE